MDAEARFDDKIKFRDEKIKSFVQILEFMSQEYQNLQVKLDSKNEEIDELREEGNKN